MKRDGQEKKLNKKLIIFGVIAVILIGLSVYAAVSKVSDSRTNTFISTQISNAVQESKSAVTSSTESDGSTVWVSDDTDWTNTSAIIESKDFTWTADTDTSYTYKYVRVQNVDDDDENNTDAYVRVTFVPRWINDTIYSSEDEDGSTEQITDEDGSYVSVDVLNNDEISASGSGSSTYYGFYNFTVDTTNNKAYWTNSYYETSSNSDDIILTLTLADNWSDYWFYNETDGYFYYKNALAPGESTAVLVTKVTIDNKFLENISNAGDTIQFELDVISDSVQALGGAIADYGASTDDDSVRWKNVQKNTDGSLTETSTE